MPAHRHIFAPCFAGFARSICLLFCVLLAVGRTVSADLTIDLTFVGSAGNAPDDTGRGAVGYSYYIGTYEITVGQYTEFLNTKAKTDPYGLYSSYMGGGTPEGAFITRTGADGDYTYTAVAGQENQPVREVSFYDGMRLANWMSNGQGAGDTENGSYDLSLGAYAVRQPGATWVMPTEDEWYKAAYYDSVNDVYYDYPYGTDDVPPEPTDGVTPRLMNFGDDPYWAPGGPWIYYTDVGATTGRSTYGTWDQGGGVEEWTETFSTPDYRVLRGGHLYDHETDLRNTATAVRTPGAEGSISGFRVAYIIPEPATGVMLSVGLLFLATRQIRTHRIQLRHTSDRGRYSSPRSSGRNRWLL